MHLVYREWTDMGSYQWPAVLARSDRPNADSRAGANFALTAFSVVRGSKLGRSGRGLGTWTASEGGFVNPA